MKKACGLVRRFRRSFAIFYEHLKAPAFIILPSLKLLGLYERGFYNAARPILREYSVSFAELPPAFDGYRLLIITDLHIDGPLPIVEQVHTLTRDLAYDLLLLLGDFRRRISGPHQQAVEKTAELLTKLRPKNGTIAVRGNHDSQELMDELQKLGVKVLTNRHACIERNGQSLWILGADDPHYDHADDLAAACNGIPADGFKILLCHTAELYEKAAAAGAHLYLCGHTHGGQICLPSGKPIITNVRAPRAWTYGFWHYRGMTGYTSSGVGCSSVPVRFNCPPEIVSITLRRETAA